VKRPLKRRTDALCIEEGSGADALFGFKEISFDPFSAMAADRGEMRIKA